MEYLDANATSGKTTYINTGLQPADNMGALVRFMPKQNSADSVMFGAKTSNDKTWYFGGSSTFYLSWNSNPAASTRPTLSPESIYDVYFNFLNDRNRRIVGVGNETDYSLAIADAWAGSGTIYPIWLFTFNEKGSPYKNGGYYRIYSAQFTQDDEVVMDLIPVRKDGAGYMFDKVTGALLANIQPSGAPDFVYGDDVADESYIEGTITLDADTNWISRGILHIDSSATIDLNGHSLTIAGAYGSGTITDSSSGTPGTLRLPAGAPFAATTSGNITVLRSDKPYDAQVKYLEAPLDSSSKVPYIDTGLIPADDLGVRLRVAPLRPKDDTTVCGALSTVTVNKKNVDWRWYMGFISANGGGYMSWGTGNPGSSQRFPYSANTIYDIIFNHCNNRNRRVEEVSGSYSLDVPITDAWPSGASHSIYLFAYNNKGTPGNTGNARIYSAQFTQGGNVVMDLIPVRKNGVGYMYDKVSETLLAKVETAPGAFTYVNDAADVAYIEGTVTLDADADWISRGILRIDPSATIDLNGHSLTIAGAYGTGTITNSSATVGEVRFVVPERMEQTSAIRLLGNLRVVKEGAGTLSLSRTGQTFTGGVTVSAGVATAVADESNGCWGADGGTIRVSSGAVFSINGKGNFYLKDFILDGGTISNNVAMTGYGLGNVTLEADSSLITAGTYRHFVFSSPDGSRSIDLGSHTLTVSTEYGTQFYLHEPVVNGTLVFDKQTSGSAGGWLRVVDGESGGSQTMNLEMVTSAIQMEGALSVSNYVARYDGAYNRGAPAIKVYGTFTPAAVLANGTERFHGCEMQDGSTIDLSAKSGTWGNVATGFSATSGDDNGNRTVTFATNATVTIDVHGRELAKGAKIVAWDAVPENLSTLTFKFDDETVPLLATSDGIYYNVTDAEVATAHWTGAANDGDVANPLNWACTNYVGAPVADGLPLGSSEVHVSGDVAFDITAEKPLAYNTLSFDSARLTNDCDWSGLAAWAASTDLGDTTDLGSVDLNGHALRLAAPQIAGTLYDFITLSVTDTSAGEPGELHIEVPLSNTYVECSGIALSGNLRLVTGGSGWLAMARANQTFTGGVVVAEGTAYSPNNNRFPEDKCYWGPAGGTITIMTNATFDARGNTNMYCKSFILNGGTLACTDSMAEDRYGFGNVTLVADSRFNMPNRTTFLNPLDPAAKVNLGGHSLTVELGASSGASFYMPVSVENGSIAIASGGYLTLDAGTSGGSRSVNLEMSGGAFYTDGALSVSNYVARYTQRWNHGAQPLIVHGTFTPAAVNASGKEYFHGCVMQDGSCIDLSGKTNVWSVVATGWPVAGYESDADGSRTISFADGATVGVLLGNRKVVSHEKLIDWTDAVPENRAGLTFYGVYANGRTVPLKNREDGVYEPLHGLMFIVR